jgi:hypothetical protein
VTTAADLDELQTRTLPKSVANALDEELNRLEDLRAQGWQVLAALLFTSSLVASALVDPNIALPGVVCSALLFGWFVVVRRAIKARKLSAVHKGVTLVLEIVAPWVMLAGILAGADARVALAAWGPLFFFVGIMILTLLRLDAQQALLCGVLGGVRTSPSRCGSRSRN